MGGVETLISYKVAFLDEAANDWAQLDQSVRIRLSPAIERLKRDPDKYFLMKELVWCLADEVLDSGEFLLVRKGVQEDRIALSRIINVSYSPHCNPKRITLTLREPSCFGHDIAFSPPVHFSLNPLQKHPLVSELIERTDAARNAATIRVTAF